MTITETYEFKNKGCSDYIKKKPHIGVLKPSSRKLDKKRNPIHYLAGYIDSNKEYEKQPKIKSEPAIRAGSLLFCMVLHIYYFAGAYSCTHTFIFGAHFMPGCMDKMDCLYSSRL